ncbi:TRAP transporter large permease [Antarcticimicrobium sediminis]|uniref:TRAP transporter large permease protein n=1 Tax=Antarcticimicrobium sediminis TaxID=2546227 RepID=A0A4R5EPZ7_9RHOB|nr:TRAP transporter large permease [Antarcticimicrobium sediminis]TDE36728.1 TRAP transporter large permease [Antarcticimicrobium sediminis]
MGPLFVALAFFGLLAFGMPVGFAIGIAGLIGIAEMGTRFLAMAPDRLFAGLDLFPFLAMPFFILAGEIMNRSGITQGLVKLADALVGWLRGGMAHSNMVASVMFAGITGSATADAAAFGNTLVPAMEKAGYTRAYACAVTAAGSIIGPTIPPSTLAIIYGSIMGVSISGLFAAGILPGLLICVICMAVIAFTARRKNLPKSASRPSLKRIAQALREGIFAAILPVFILGSILGGFATPTEAAAIAVAYALFVGGVIYRALSWRDLYDIAVRTTRITGVIFLIIAAATILGWWMTFNQIPQMVAKGLLSISDNPNVIIGLILLLLLLIGLVMDINATLIILAPVLGPLTVQIGMDPVHAGIMIILALNISLMTPPVGACLFVLSSVTREKIEAITRELWPFILAEVGVLLVVAFWSDLTLFVPRLLGF